ncbi:methylmalonyl-CoA epimerase [Gemmatimonadota bacterium]
MTESERQERLLVHVAIAVDDLDRVVELYTGLLGTEPEQITTNSDFDVRAAIFRTGQVKIELLEGIGPESAVTRFIEKNGPGLHHLCFSVDDLKGTLADLSRDGIEIIGDGDDIGVEGYPVAFAHPKSTGGVLLEFIEEPDGSTNGKEDRS